ncbi:MAG: PaaI family thioesterase [Myxococcota bacterium]
MTIDIDSARAQLDTAFAPWVRALGASVESLSSEGARLHLPFSNSLCRADGIICGQALMTLVDTCSVFSSWGALGEFRNITTVDQNTSFLRPVVGKAVIADGRIRKAGKTLIFPEVHLFAEGDDRLVAHGTSTFAILPGTLQAP